MPALTESWRQEPFPKLRAEGGPARCTRWPQVDAVATSGALPALVALLPEVDEHTHMLAMNVLGQVLEMADSEPPAAELVVCELAALRGPYGQAVARDASRQLALEAELAEELVRRAQQAQRAQGQRAPAGARGPRLPAKAGRAAAKGGSSGSGAQGVDGQARAQQGHQAPPPQSSRPAEGSAAAGGSSSEKPGSAACAKCGALPPAGQRHRLCAGCKKLRYCSPECQKAHWHEHKPACLAAKAG
jgi:hypothetical protein